MRALAPTLVALALTACASSLPERSTEDAKTLAEELERQGATVVEQSGRYDVMVASGPEIVAHRVSTILGDAEIPHSGSFGLGHGGIYVEVSDLERARHLLLREKARQNLTDLWIFTPKEP